MINKKMTDHFNPRSPHRERPKSRRRQRVLQQFQSTLPSQGATDASGNTGYKSLYFNPRSPHRERPTADARVPSFLIISIHAPLTGSDAKATKYTDCKKVFQSTLPSQGATAYAQVSERPTTYFNPRSPHRERRNAFFSPASAVVISIHAPLTGSDNLFSGFVSFAFDFNPRSPHRERLMETGGTSDTNNFNPRSPHRERRYVSSPATSVDAFQSTLPSQGATGSKCGLSYWNVFQSTLPSQGATCPFPLSVPVCKFQSTLPSQGATCFLRCLPLGCTISIHAPITGSDA